MGQRAFLSSAIVYRIDDRAYPSALGLDKKLFQVAAAPRAKERLSKLSGPVNLLKLDGPVGVVEELLPASVTLVAEVDMDKGVSFWPDGFLDEGQLSLFWVSAALFHVAVGAGTDHICPG